MNQLSDYTDHELYQFLGFLHKPTDGELEAKLIQLLNQSNTDDEMYLLLEQIFTRFFVTPDDEEEEKEDQENYVVEGFESSLPNATANAVTKPNAAAPAKTPEIQPPPPESGVAKPYKPPIYDTPQKKTRVIVLDSRVRDRNLYPNSTSFVLYLSEPLTHVTIIKFHWIQIPYTWYTISNAYGANFFYLRGTTPGIFNQHLKISIPPGNYTSPSTLVGAVSDSIKTLAASRTDINFGSTDINVNPVNGLASLTIDIHNRFGDSNYNLVFPRWVTGSTTQIPGFLGFQSALYPLGSVTSDLTFVTHAADSTSDLDIEHNQYLLKNTNNFFTVYNYKSSSSPFSTTTSTIFNTIVVTLKDAVLDAYYARVDLLGMVNEALKSQPLFQSSLSNMVFNEDSLSYRLNIQLNRRLTNNGVFTKQAIVFPDESSHPNTAIWSGSSSAFLFPSTTILLNTTLAEFPAVPYEYELTDNSNTITLTCNLFPGGATNSFNVAHTFTTSPLDSSTLYSLTSLLQQCNLVLRTELTRRGFFVQTTSPFFYYDYDGDGVVKADFLFSLPINATSFSIDATTSIFATLLGLPDTMTTAVEGVTSRFSPQSTYVIDSTNNFININFVAAGANETTIKLAFLPQGTYTSLSSLEDAINGKGKSTKFGGFASLQGRTTMYGDPLYGLNLSQSSIVLTSSGQCTLIWNISATLTQQDFTLTLNGNLWTESLGFTNDTLSFDLNVFSKVGSAFASIAGEDDVTTEMINIYDSPSLANNVIQLHPKYGAESVYTSTLDNVLTFTLDVGSYTRYALTRALNRALSDHPVTAGSRFFWTTDADENEMVAVAWNVNLIYNAQDYALTFYDINEFVHEEVNIMTGNRSVVPMPWDHTLGWMLGYRSNIAFPLAKSSDPSYPTVKVNSETSVAVVQGDTPVNMYLYNHFHVILDEFAPNQLSDGVVTVGSKDTYVPTETYASVAAQKLNPLDLTTVLPGVKNTAKGNTSDSLTVAQTIAANAQVWAGSKSAADLLLSTPPNINNMFAVIPLKLAGVQVGQSIVENSGTLQDNNRRYAGPVDIFRLGLRLASDRGDLVDLNNNDWSIGLVIEMNI